MFRGQMFECGNTVYVNRGLDECERPFQLAVVIVEYY